MMDKERIAYMNAVIDRLHGLSTEERTAALAHLYSLRTAAVEDLASPDDEQFHWDSMLESSTQPVHIMTLVRDLVQLTKDELVMVGIQVSARQSGTDHDQSHRSMNDRKGLQSWASPATNTDHARESYIEAHQDLAKKHQATIANKMNSIRDAIEQGINNGQDVTALEEVFDRLEREFWDHHLGSGEDVEVKKEEQ